MRKRTARVGFTLIELLIVIVIVGILTGVMMLSSGSATDSARAVACVSNLRSAKLAALVYFSDNVASSDANIKTVWKAGFSLKGYLDDQREDSPLEFVASDTPNFYVGMEVDTDGVKSKLKAQAEAAALLGSASATTVPAETYSAHNFVWMRVK